MGGFVGRMAARWKGEVGAEALEAFRRAGGVVYSDFHEAELVRQRLAAEGADPWHPAPATAAQLLCAWNAFVVQTLGEHLLDADYDADPRTAGFLPEVTHRQVARCFKDAERWSSLARQAAAGHAPTMGHLPVELPGWVETDPCTVPHLKGLMAATRTVRRHAEVAWGLFEPVAGGTAAPVLDRPRALLAKGTAAADYAEALLGGDPLPELCDAIETRLHQALADFHRLGQLIAMPSLIDTRSRPSVPDPRPDSGESPYRIPEAELLPPPPPDPSPDRVWRMTSPYAADKYARSTERRAVLEELWRHDTDPAATLEVQTRLEAMLVDGRIEYATGRNGGLHPPYPNCPWGAIYRTRSVVKVNGQIIEKGELFTYRPRVYKGGFSRRILVGAKAIANS